MDASAANTQPQQNRYAERVEQAEKPTAGRLLVIMPAWNESASVGNTVAEVIRTVPNCDVLVVRPEAIELIDDSEYAPYE